MMGRDLNGMPATARPLERRDSPAAPAWMTLAAAAAILLAVLAAYHNSFNAPFVLDDRNSIVTNAAVRELWPPRMLMPRVDEGVTYDWRPLLYLSFAVNYALGGLDVRGYHVFNLAVHVLAALTLFGLLRRTFGAERMGEPFRRAALPLALAAALLWAVHPLHTTAVTYIAQRAESLMSLFYLVTLYCLARSVGSGRAALWQAGGVAACLLGALTKEVVVTAPLAALLYDRTFLAGSFREALRLRWRFYAGLAATWLVLGILMGTAGTRGGTVGFALGLGGWGYLRTQGVAILHYLRLFVWPSPLIFDYGGLWVTDVARVLFSGLAVAGLAALSVYALWRWPAAGFAGAFFFLVLSPTSSVVPVVTTMAEYRVYLALAAPCALLAAGVYAAWRRWAGGRLSGRRGWAVPGALLAVAVTAASAATVRRNEVYRTEIGLWQDVVGKMPGSSSSTFNLGVAYQRGGDLAEAIRFFEKAVALQPSHDLAHNNLGLGYLTMGRREESIAALERAVALRPDKPRYRMNLGAALTLAGRYEEALKHLNAAAERLPEDTGILSNLGNALWMSGRTDEATDLFRKVVRLAPEFPEGRNNLGYALIEQGRPGEAIPHLEAAARLSPGTADIHYNLGRALLASGEAERAAEHFSIALRLKPGDVESRRYLEQALAAQPPTSKGKR